MNRLKKLLALGLTVACLSAAIPTALAAGSRFTDVPAGADYAAAVDYVVQQGLMNGTSATTFDPDGALTRSAMAMILYRASGSPTVYGASSFGDVQARQWYTDAVTWASATGVMQGYGGGRFAPNEPVSQEQLRVLLGRYTGNPVDWTGDPALASAATRGQVAVALEEANITRNQALYIARQGMFSSGGTVTEPVAGEYDATTNWLELERHGNTAHVGHANVYYQIPQNDTGLPMVYLHGYGQSRMGWMTTPDGRDGWSTMFLQKGHSAFLVDQPGRGEAGAATQMTTDGMLDAWAADSKEYKPGDQAWYTHFRIGRVAPERYEGSQFPEGDDVQNQFFRQMTPNTTTFDQAACADALGHVMADVKAMTGKKAIFVTHSQGGAVGWDVPVENIAAIVAIEPGGTPQPGSEQYKRLLEAKIPIVVYFGDYIDNGPEDIMSTGFWKNVRDGALAFAEQYNADGGNATVVDLPKVGITGNSHFMFQERNNAVIADHIETWIQANVK